MTKKELHERLGEINFIILGLEEEKVKLQQEGNTIILKLRESESDGNN